MVETTNQIWVHMSSYVWIVLKIMDSQWIYWVHMSSYSWMVLIIVNKTTKNWWSTHGNRQQRGRVPKICCENCGRDDIGHCAGKVRAFPHRQEQFLSKELVVLQQHLAQQSAPRWWKTTDDTRFLRARIECAPNGVKEISIDLLYILHYITIYCLILLLIIYNITIDNIQHYY